MSAEVKRKEATYSAKQIAELISTARTPGERGTATRRLKAYVAKRASAGCDPVRVEANIKALVNRLSRGDN